MVQIDWKIIGNNSLMRGSNFIRHSHTFIDQIKAFNPLWFYCFQSSSQVFTFTIRSRFLKKMLLPASWDNGKRNVSKRLFFVCLFIFVWHASSVNLRPGQGLTSDTNPSPISDYPASRSKGLCSQGNKRSTHKGNVHTIPDAFSTATVIIPDSASVHT